MCPQSVQIFSPKFRSHNLRSSVSVSFMLLMNMKLWLSEISNIRLKSNESVCMLNIYEGEALKRLDIHCVISCILTFLLNIYNPRTLRHNMEMVVEFLCNSVLLMLLRLCGLSCREQQL